MRAVVILIVVASLFAAGCGASSQDATSTSTADVNAPLAATLQRYNAALDKETNGDFIDPMGKIESALQQNPHNCNLGYAKLYPDTVLLTAYGTNRWVQILIPLHGRIDLGPTTVTGGFGSIPQSLPSGGPYCGVRGGHLYLK